MEKKIIFSYDGNKPVPDFIKDQYEVLVGKTQEGVEHYHLIELEKTKNSTTVKKDDLVSKKAK